VSWIFPVFHTTALVYILPHLHHWSSAALDLALSGTVAAAHIWNNLLQHVTSAPSLLVFWSFFKTSFHHFLFQSVTLYIACTVVLVILDTLIVHVSYLRYLRRPPPNTVWSFVWGVVFLSWSAVYSSMHPEKLLTQRVEKYMTYFHWMYISDSLLDRNECFSFWDPEVNGHGGVTCTGSSILWAEAYSTWSSVVELEFLVILLLLHKSWCLCVSTMALVSAQFSCHVNS